MRQARRLFAFPDPGWLYLIAGLAMGVALILIPAERDLRELQGQLRRLEEEHAGISERLAAHSSFLDALDREDPDLVRRLAAAQLNQAPEGDIPLLLASNRSASMTAWIESSLVSRTPPEAASRAPSRLARLAEGPYRLWLLGGSVLCIFIGLVVGARVDVEAEAGAAAEDDPVDGLCDPVADPLATAVSSGRGAEGADLPSPARIEEAADDVGRGHDLGAEDVDRTIGDTFTALPSSGADIDDRRETDDSDVDLHEASFDEDFAIEVDVDVDGSVEARERDDAEHAQSPASTTETIATDDPAWDEDDQGVLPFDRDASATERPAATMDSIDEPADAGTIEVEVEFGTPRDAAAGIEEPIDERCGEIDDGVIDERVTGVPDGVAAEPDDGTETTAIEESAAGAEGETAEDAEDETDQPDDDEGDDEWEYEYVYVDEDGNEIDPEETEEDDEWEYEYEYVDADDELEDGEDEADDDH